MDLVNMRNFKQYLIEEVDNYITLGIMTYVHINSDIQEYQKNINIESDLKKILSQHYDIKFFSFDKQNNKQYSLYIRIGLKDDKNYSYQDIDSIRNSFYEDLVILYPTIDKVEKEFGSLYINLDKMPQHKIECNTISIYFNKESNLKNIDKVVDCQLFSIVYPQNIIGNVLSILKIKSLKKMHFAESKTNKWPAIVKKYIQSRDILECQDELIDNGLSAYAKL
jgi:hypothetical protein